MGRDLTERRITPVRTPSLRREHAQPACRDERGSIVMVLFLIITASILILTAAGIAISQQVVAQQTLQRNDALQAAEAGLDAALSEIRNATNGTTGEVEDLPCNGTDDFTLSGSLGTPNAQYTVSVTYYEGDDPPTQNQVANDTVVDCFSNSESNYPSQVPDWALIIATGQDAASGSGTPPKRELQEVYAFQNTNLDVPGGSIHDFDYNGSTDDLCMIDPTTPAAANNRVYMETCQADGTSPDEYTWSYEPNETIELSATSSGTEPLCLYGNVSTDTVTLVDCTQSSTLWWGVNGNAQLMPETADGAENTENLCLNEETGTPIQLDLATCAISDEQQQSWAPTREVGPGQAGGGTYQYVNYQDFGYCLDVSNQNVSQVGATVNESGEAEPYEILYLCKQFEDGAGWSPTSGTSPGDPIWNQRFVSMGDYTYNDNGETYHLLETPYTSSLSTSYCLYSPLEDATGNDDPSGDNGSWVIVEPCPSIANGPVTQQSDLPFLWSIDTSVPYNIMDVLGECLNADNADQQIPDGGSDGEPFATATVAGCDATSESEEWNAPPIVQQPGVSDVFEPTLSGN